jgi:hypothetical protein
MGFARKIQKKKARKLMPAQKSKKTLKGTKLAKRSAGSPTQGRISTFMSNTGHGPKSKGMKKYY